MLGQEKREALKLRQRISRLHYDLISALPADDQPDEAAKGLGDARKRFRHR